MRLIKAKLAGGANAQPMPGGLLSSGDAVTEEMMVQRDAAGGLIGKARVTQTRTAYTPLICCSELLTPP